MFHGHTKKTGHIVISEIVSIFMLCGYSIHTIAVAQKATGLWSMEAM